MRTINEKVIRVFPSGSIGPYVLTFLSTLTWAVMLMPQTGCGDACSTWAEKMLSAPKEEDRDFRKRGEWDCPEATVTKVYLKIVARGGGEEFDNAAHWLAARHVKGADEALLGGIEASGGSVDQGKALRLFGDAPRKRLLQILGDSSRTDKLRQAAAVTLGGYANDLQSFDAELKGLMSSTDEKTVVFATHAFDAIAGQIDSSMYHPDRIDVRSIRDPVHAARLEAYVDNFEATQESRVPGLRSLRQFDPVLLKSCRLVREAPTYFEKRVSLPDAKIAKLNKCFDKAYLNYLINQPDFSFSRKWAMDHGYSVLPMRR